VTIIEFIITYPREIVYLDFTDYGLLAQTRPGATVSACGAWAPGGGLDGFENLRSKAGLHGTCMQGTEAKGYRRQKCLSGPSDGSAREGPQRFTVCDSSDFIERLRS